MRWEYKKVEDDDVYTNDLNRLGKQGWELVSVVATGNPQRYVPTYTAVLKRPLPN